MPDSPKTTEAELLNGLVAAMRAAKLALFVIRKHGVMPNDSWRAGFDRDMATAEAAWKRARHQPIQCVGSGEHV